MVKIKSINIDNSIKRFRRHKYLTLKKTKATIRPPRTSQSKPKREVIISIGIFSSKSRVKGELNFKKAFSLFKEMLERQRDTEGIILNIMEYLIKGYKIKPELYEKMELEMLKERLIKKGGYMDIRDYIKEEGRQEGRQTERQQVVLNMLKEKSDIAFISKVTGLSKEEIKKLKKGK